ncbi:hypothetical protein LSH36_317g02051 [Paralvinella palmiformis]|uniref:RING-type domain-containing protein n=1 Tax=Paralvinella palmiformis TaxID=53620 RepID=A0AAD9JI23_9ANNE|nr:hypothetical protein LSH36_317g02051 [Paralvinella palmiformis]
MPNCLVPGCPNNLDITSRRREMSFFQVPDAEKNPRKWKMAEGWLKFCGLEINGFQFGARRAVICEKHFLPEDMEILYPRKSENVFRNQHPPKRVKFGAVPKLRNGCEPLPGPFAEKITDIDEEKPDDAKCVQEDDSKHTTDDVVPELDKPLTVERQEAAELARWPPDVKIPVAELNAILTCDICKGYFYNATTITECLHTFCKGCLVNHFYRSLSCPKCNIMVHPSDPFVNIRPDAILQDIVYKIFPQRLKDDQQAEVEFYSSRGLNAPMSGDEFGVPPPPRDPPEAKMVSLRLDYAGTTPSLPAHQTLKKNFLRIPNSVTTGQIIKFLHLKMDIPLNCQAALFINCFMLSDNLKLSRLEEIFGEQIQDTCKDMIFLQYGVIPKGNYFDKGLILSTKYL